MKKISISLVLLLLALTSCSLSSGYRVSVISPAASGIGEGMLSEVWKRRGSGDPIIYQKRLKTEQEEILIYLTLLQSCRSSSGELLGLGGLRQLFVGLERVHVSNYLRSESGDTSVALVDAELNESPIYFYYYGRQKSAECTEELIVWTWSEKAAQLFQTTTDPALVLQDEQWPLSQHKPS